MHANQPRKLRKPRISPPAQQGVKQPPFNRPDFSETAWKRVFKQRWVIERTRFRIGLPSGLSRTIFAPLSAVAASQQYLSVLLILAAFASTMSEPFDHGFQDYIDWSNVDLLDSCYDQMPAEAGMDLNR